MYDNDHFFYCMGFLIVNDFLPNLLQPYLNIPLESYFSLFFLKSWLDAQKAPDLINQIETPFIIFCLCLSSYEKMWKRADNIKV